MKKIVILCVALCMMLGICSAAQAQKTPCVFHKWGEWVTFGVAPCASDSISIRRCTVCDQAQVMNRPIANHVWGSWLDETPATCGNSGVSTRQCVNCGASESTTTPPTGNHQWSWKTISELTCITDGVQQRVCGVCGKSETTTAVAPGHDYGAWVPEKSPTCTEKGKEVNKCRRCGQLWYRGLDELGHEWGEWEVVCEPTDTMCGVALHECLRGDAYELREISNLNGENFVLPDLPAEGADDHRLSVIMTVANEPANGDYFVEKEVIHFRVTVTNSWDQPLSSLAVEEMMRPIAGVVAAKDMLAPGKSFTVEIPYAVTERDCWMQEAANYVICSAVIDDGTMIRKASNRVAARTEFDLAFDEGDGHAHPRTDAILHETCYKIIYGCPVCHEVFNEVETGKDCKVTDAFLFYAPVDAIASFGCPVCGMEYSTQDLNSLKSDDWTAWVGNGNGTHSRTVKADSSIVETAPCYEDASGEKCGACGAAYIRSGLCVALTDIPVFTIEPERFAEEDYEYTLLVVIPEGATYTVISNGDHATVKYAGVTGEIYSDYVNFVHADE